MTHKTKKQKQTPLLTQAATQEQNKQEKMKKEALEVVDKHQQDGHKDHKGAR